MIKEKEQQHKPQFTKHRKKKILSLKEIKKRRYIKNLNRK